MVAVQFFWKKLSYLVNLCRIMSKLFAIVQLFQPSRKVWISADDVEKVLVLSNAKKF